MKPRGIRADADLIRRKISQARNALARIVERLPSSPQALRQDFDAQDVVYRNFQIVVQNCADMAAHLIAENGWEMPRSLAEGFDILAVHKVIPASLAKSLRNLAVLRNILVHDYSRVDLERAFPLLRSSRSLAPRFCGLLLARVGEKK